MPKRVAIVDIGSNSARVVIYQRTSRFGFHLIAQKKANVRISEGSFEKNGELQEKAINRAIEALQSFQTIIKDYKARKTIVVATAAVRNAPNRSDFIQRVRREVGLNIKVIDGHKEAYFGAVAAKNLLPVTTTAVSVDIGGGSCDIALIQKDSVVATFSLNIGTITIKELFFDKKRPLHEAKEYILSEVKKIPEIFREAKEIIAIGGVLRALSKSIIIHSNYSYNKIHAFEYKISHFASHVQNIINAKEPYILNTLHIKANRYDTIREGLLIFTTLQEHLQIDSVMTSGVGVREGVFLHDMLRSVGGHFPKELNPSVVSIVDRLDMIGHPKKSNIQIARKLFHLLKDKNSLKEHYLQFLIDAIKISDTGKTLTIYDEHKHTYYIAEQELNWQYTHQEMLLIAIIVRSKKEKLLYKTLYREHKKLLPPRKILEWLSFIYNLSNTLATYAERKNFTFELREKSLIIISKKRVYLLKEELQTFELPKEFHLKFKNL